MLRALLPSPVLGREFAALALTGALLLIGTVGVTSMTVDHLAPQHLMVVEH